jgi:CRISPR-associated endoribonuclease Cas6
MRFRVKFNLSNEIIPKDKNRVILSFLKTAYSKYDMDYYKSLYEENQPKRKSFTFSTYMPQAKFLQDEIIIPSCSFDLEFSSYDNYDSLIFYNSIVGILNKSIDIKGNSITAKNIINLKEKPIFNDYAKFKTLSPISIREHNGDNKTTWYHLLDTQKGKDIFLHNIKIQALDQFGDKAKYDLDDLKLSVIKTKEVRVKHYDIVIPSNLAIIEIQAKPYLLDYFYKAGVCSQRSSGFGMLDLI